MSEFVGDPADICACRNDRASHKGGMGACSYCGCRMFTFEGKHARRAEPEPADLANARLIALAAIYQPALERLADDLAGRVLAAVAELPEASR